MLKRLQIDVSRAHEIILQAKVIIEDLKQNKEISQKAVNSYYMAEDKPQGDTHIK